MFLSNWQLSSKANLTPKEYNMIGVVINTTTNEISDPDITKDILCHYNTSVLEVWQFGFGQQCGVTDLVVQAINKKLNKTSTIIKNNDAVNYKLPMIMRSTLLGKFITLFFERTDTFDTKNSSCNQRCDPFPIPPRYTSSPEGRRLLKFFRYDGNVNMYNQVLVTDALLSLAMRLVNLFGFCISYLNNSTSILSSFYHSSRLFDEETFLKINAKIETLLNKHFNYTNNQNKNISKLTS